MCSLGAFVETVRIYKENDACKHLWAYGEKLRDGMQQVAKECGVDNYFNLDGPAISISYITRDATGAPSTAFRTLFGQEMIRNGVLMPWIAISLSHTDVELQITLTAVRKALKVYSMALKEGVEKYLQGAVVKPVFRKHN